MRPRIERNIKTGLYVTSHAGIDYHLPFELLDSIKGYWDAHRGTTADWYDDLPGDDKRLVTRLNLPLSSDDIFYPDMPAD